MCSSDLDGQTSVFLVLGDRVGNGSVKDLKGGEQVQYQSKDNVLKYVFVNLVNGSLGKTARPTSPVGLRPGDIYMLKSGGKFKLELDPKKSTADVFLVDNGKVKTADLKVVQFGNQVQFVEKDGKAVVVFKGKQTKREGQ